jgi:nucleoside-diphosphate kinase
MIEKTLVIIKPDGVEKKLIGEVIKRLENAGLSLVDIKMMKVDAEFVEAHYTLDPEWRRITGEKRIAAARERGLTPPSEDPFEITTEIIRRLQKYITRGAVIPMVWEGENAVHMVRKVGGGTEPASAEKGTLRGDYATDSYELADKENRSIENIIHASGSVKEAEMEIHHWFLEIS